MAVKRRKAAYQKRYRNRTGIILITAVLAMMMIVVGVQTFQLRQQQKEYEKEEQYYLELIAQEEARSLEIAEFEKYTHTTAYVEEIAKLKFGLVNDGEILFIAEQ